MSKEIKGFRPGSKKWKNFMAKLYGLGAAVVIVGALFKIQHWPYAGPMLIAGLSTEAVIFIFSAFEPPHEEPDWTLVYPELALPAEYDEMEELETVKETREEEPKGSVTEQLDNMLEEAKIGPELLESLGDGLRSLTDQANKLTDITDASVATNDYVSSVKSASEQVNELTESYVKASESLASISVSEEDGNTYGEQMVRISKNLSELNTVYELQLQGSNDQLDASKELTSGMGELIKNLNDSLEDTRKYKDHMSELSTNLNSLNTVYGNMLSAMGMSGAKMNQDV